MLRSLYSFIRFYLFWLLFFALTRLTFELYYFDKLRGVGFGEFLKSYISGIRMDASATAYIAILPLVIFIINWFSKPEKHVKPIWLKLYTWFCIFFIRLI